MRSSISVNVILILIIILLLFLIRLKTDRVIVAVCCIDERSHELSSCVASLKKDLFYDRIIGVFRKSDVQCKAFFDHFVEVEDYPSPGPDNRHNLEGLLEQRNAALLYAKRHGFDRLVFIDSDIEVDWYTVPYLLLGCVFADVTCIPYGIRWAGMKPVLGYDHPPRIEQAQHGLFPFHVCSVAGMGCTCIALDSSSVPETFSVGEVLGVKGEDIGFFLDAREKGARVWAASWYTVKHTKEVRPNSFPI